MRGQFVVPDVLVLGVVVGWEVGDGDGDGVDGVVILIDVCMSVLAYDRGLLARHW